MVTVLHVLRLVLEEDDEEDDMAGVYGVALCLFVYVLCLRVCICSKGEKGEVMFAVLFSVCVCVVGCCSLFFLQRALFVYLSPANLFVLLLDFII